MKYCLSSRNQRDYLSKADLDISSKKLEIAKAEMALEDARASKNSMRLTRGADGNWSYQYVADADNIADKQQELLNNQNDLYQLTQDAYKDSLEKIVDLEQSTKDKIKEIANSQVLTQEEKEKKIADKVNDNLRLPKKLDYYA
jgi:ABC-type transporter lipoprotein component MlaA